MKFALEDTQRYPNMGIPSVTPRSAQQRPWEEGKKNLVPLYLNLESLIKKPHEYI